MSRAVEAADVLRRLGACDDAIAWLRERSCAVEPERRTAEAAWMDCERSDWLVWIVTQPAVRKAVGDRVLRLIACDCAERVLPLYERAHPGDPRPRRAIEVSRRYADGLASLNELREARRRAAYTAADSAAASYDDAACAACAAAISAARAAADSAAASYADAYAAYAAERRAQAEIVRRRVPWSHMRDALRPIAEVLP